MAQASAVISSGRNECRISSTDTPENPRISMAFGDVTVFFAPDDAHQIGAELIAKAALISSAFNPSTLTRRDSIIPPALVPVGHEDYPEERE
jgi:hypothetical protein